MEPPTLKFFSLPSVNAYYYLFLVLCIFVIFFSSRLQESRLGRAWAQAAAA